MKPYLATFTADILVHADSPEEAHEKAGLTLENFCAVTSDIIITEY